MAEKLHFELVSPERLLRSDEVTMVVVPGSEGDFGVLAGHAPLMSTIRPGAITIYANDMDHVTARVFIDGGFAEVGDNGLTILAESAVPVEEIDVTGVAKELAEARAEASSARSDAEKALAEKRVERFEAMQAAATH